MKVKITIDYVRYSVDEEDVPELLRLMLKLRKLEQDYQTSTITLKPLSIEIGHLNEDEQVVVYT